ncbi:MAG TPA: hypothetical protein VFW94_19475 [Candidatus Acidoferrales bacterium]|nr:hypothetical protein [Candidatus Acidoferrales bacterium]
MLTTQTAHHTYFVREIAARYPAIEVFCEQDVLEASFDTAHVFEEVRDRYENMLWFSGVPARLSDFGPVTTSPTINDETILAGLQRFDPDVLVDFGTGKVKSPVLGFKPDRLFNLHGGDPQQYRGLDSHLWAIYNSDFAGLVTTLHRLSATLDAGDIVLLREVPIRPGMLLHELRAATTQVCVDIALAALAEFETAGNVNSTPQRARGRYYSFMPAALKEECRRKFEDFTRDDTPLNCVRERVL